MNIILTLFRKKLVTETEESSRKKEPKTKTSKSKKSVKVESETTSLETPSSSVVTESIASIAARRLMESFNNHNEEELTALMASDCIVQFKDVEISGYAFIEGIASIDRSFPDFKVSYDKIVDIGPNVAKLCNVRASGTHTGEPYGFGPFPPIATTGIKVLNDPEEITVTIDERTGLITKTHNVANGHLSGPSGFYQQIGGTF